MIKPTRTATLTFFPGDKAPMIPPGYEKYFLVAVKRSARPVSVFPALYLNRYPLTFEFGCAADDCHEKHQDGCPTTGWYAVESSNSEFDSLYFPLLHSGDALIEWAPMPEAPHD